MSGAISTPLSLKPTGSRLQRVDINLLYTFLEYDDMPGLDHTEVSRRVLDALPLLREKGILFVEAQTVE